MVDFLKMEKVLSDLEDKSKMLEEDINKAKEVLALLREQYHADTNSSDVNISKLILDRVPELKKCCDDKCFCYLPEEGQDGIQALSDISKRKIKAKSVLVYIETISILSRVSRIYLCEDQVVTCSLDGGRMLIRQIVPYNEIEDIIIGKTSGSSLYGECVFYIKTANEDGHDNDVRGNSFVKPVFEIIRTILWDCYEALN